MSSSQNPSRAGEYRDRALDHYGRFCQKCTWAPQTEAEEHKLHVHHETPHQEGGPDAVENLTVLCRDCHLARHSDSAFSHELVGRLTNALEDSLTHKRDGFGARVSRRVRLDSVYIIDGNPPANFANAAHGYVLVEGVLDGDHYDSYFIDTDQPYLSMCSCYTHSFGTHRAHEICTHVGAALVRQAIERVKENGEEPALGFIRDMGEKLDEKAQEYVKKEELVQKGLDTLDIEDRFSESWAQRARAQAKKMTRYGEEWKCFGSECEGCEIRLTAEGYVCSDSRDKGWEKKFPCPGKLGAHILNETEGQTVSPSIDEGHLFKLTRSRQDIPLRKGDFAVTTEVNYEEENATLRSLESGDAFVLDFRVLTDAIIAKTLKTAKKRDITRQNKHARLLEENGIPVALAPDISPTDVFHVQSDSVGYLNEGDTISIVELDDDERTVLVERATPEHPFGGETATIEYDAFRQHLAANDLESGYISDIFDIIATEVVTAYGTKKVGLYSPIEAKDDIKSLDWDETHRSWDNPIDGKWSVDGDAIESVVEHLQDNGWAVWVPRDVRAELEDD